MIWLCVCLWVCTYLFFAKVADDCYTFDGDALEQRIFKLCCLLLAPLLAVWYIVISLFDFKLSYKTKRWLVGLELGNLDWQFWFPIGKRQHHTFYGTSRRQFYHYKYVLSETLVRWYRNIKLLNPFSLYANFVGQQLLSHMAAKLYENNLSRVYEADKAVFYSYTVTFGYLTIYSYEEDEQFDTKKNITTLYQGFIYTSNQASKVFRLFMSNPSYKYWYEGMFCEGLYSYLLFLVNGDNADLYKKQVKKVGKYTMLGYIISQWSIDCSNTSFMKALYNAMFYVVCGSKKDVQKNLEIALEQCKTYVPAFRINFY